MKNLANNIAKGKNLEIALPRFSQEMMSVYYKYSAVRLSMNYYTYNEMLKEYDNEEILTDKKHLDKLMSSFMLVVENAINNQVVGKELEKAVADIDEIRSSIIQTMKGLTSLVDIFNIYEYVLNRVEYRYKDGSQIELKDDEEFTRDIMRYILASEDKVVINANITDAVRQLPLRMTKSRFFELLKEGLRVYKDSEKSSVDDFIYMLSSSATVYRDPYTDKISQDINDIIKEFETTDFQAIDEDKYNKLHDKLVFGIEYVQQSVGEYMLLAELVNDVYVMLLAAPYADTACEEKDILKKIFEDSDDGSTEEALVKLEGRQERLNNEYAQCEYAIDMVIDKYMDTAESLMLGAQYNSLKRMSILESGSLFVEFDENKDNTIAGEEYVMNKYEELNKELKEFFASHNKLVNRAAMANVLASLPIFFNNVEEIQNYVYNSINGCSDIAEKTACVEIFASMMEDDGFDFVSQ